MSMQGGVGHRISFQAGDISVIPESLSVLETQGGRKICITVIGSGTNATVKLKLAKGSGISLPKVDGEVVSNVEVEMPDVITGSDSASIAVLDVHGYSEIALVGIETSSTVSGAVYLESIF